MRTKNITYVSIARFETLANRHVTMQRHSVIVIQSEAHPESGDIVSVELKYDGDGFILDGEHLMVNPHPIGYGFKSSAIRGGSSRMSSGPMTWKDSAQAAIRLLSDKESQSARLYCDDQDMAFLAYIGGR
jgi:hypothetical protein